MTKFGPKSGQKEPCMAEIKSLLPHVYTVILCIHGIKIRFKTTCSGSLRVCLRANEEACMRANVRPCVLERVHVWVDKSRG